MLSEPSRGAAHLDRSHVNYLIKYKEADGDIWEKRRARALRQEAASSRAGKASHGGEVREEARVKSDCERFAVK